MKQSNVSVLEGHFNFRNKPNPKGERNLYLIYNLDREKVLASTGIAVKPSDWDSKKEVVKTRHLSSAKLNLRLSKIKDRVDQLIECHKEPLTKEVLRKMLAGKYLSEQQKEENEKSRDFIRYALDYNQLCYDLEKLAYSTFHNDEYNIKKFRSYYTRESGESVLPLSEITVEIFDKYKAYCLRMENKKQSVNKKLKPLFKAVEYAGKNDLISSKLATSVCTGYFNLKSRRYETEIEDEDIHYLTMEQLHDFNNLYYKVKHDRTREFIEIFMFSFYSCGLRFSDPLSASCWGIVPSLPPKKCMPNSCRPRYPTR